MPPRSCSTRSFPSPRSPAAQATPAKRRSRVPSSALSGCRPAPTGRSARLHPARLGPVVPVGDLLADDPEKPVRPVIAEELEPLSQVLDRRLEVAVAP